MKQEIKSELTRLRFRIRSSIFSLKEYVLSDDKQLSGEAKEVMKYAESIILHTKRFK